MPLTSINQKMDGDTWMVSVIHSESVDGSSWYSERAGKNPIEAAMSYALDDTDDNPGARWCRESYGEVLICVIGQQLAVSMKPWKIYLFEITDWHEGKPVLRPFH